MSTAISDADKDVAILKLMRSDWVCTTLSALVLKAMEALAERGFSSTGKVPRTMASSASGSGLTMAWLPLVAGAEGSELTLRACLEVAAEPDALGVARFELEVLRPLLGGVGQQPNDRLLGRPWMFATPAADFPQTTVEGLEQALLAHLSGYFDDCVRPDLDSQVARFALEVDALMSQ